ncbi:MAG: hypothetical protein JNK80_07205 [Dechloromonas sp.]|jgi:hypothetical protein|nr:hypothetical protein [Dechloromonas sp.]
MNTPSLTAAFELPPLEWRGYGYCGLDHEQAGIGLCDRFTVAIAALHGDPSALGWRAGGTHADGSRSAPRE